MAPFLKISANVWSSSASGSVFMEKPSSVRGPGDMQPARRADGLGVRFTQQGNALYATILGTPTSTEVTIKGLAPTTDTTITLLGHGGVLEWQQQDEGLTITLPDHLPDWPAHAFKLLGVADDMA